MKTHVEWAICKCLAPQLDHVMMPAGFENLKDDRSPSRARQDALCATTVIACVFGVSAELKFEHPMYSTLHQLHVKPLESLGYASLVRCINTEVGHSYQDCNH